MSSEAVGVQIKIGKSLEDAGWLQGSIVNPINVLELELDESPQGYWVVVTQSCDIAHLSDEEPFMEVMLAVKLGTTEPNKLYENLKNPRKLHFVDTEFGALEIRTSSRKNIPREKFRDIRPFGHLNKDCMRTLQKFLGRRYNRAAFASEFNKRLTPKIKFRGESNKTAEARCVRVFEALEALVSSTRMLLVTEGDLEQEFSPWVDDGSTDNVYKFKLKAIRENEVSEFDVDKLFKDLRNSFNTCPGIYMDRHEDDEDIIPIHQLTYSDMEAFLRWDADSMSAESDVPIPLDEPH